MKYTLGTSHCKCTPVTSLQNLQNQRTHPIHPTTTLNPACPFPPQHTSQTLPTLPSPHSHPSTDPLVRNLPHPHCHTVPACPSTQSPCLGSKTIDGSQSRCVKRRNVTLGNPRSGGSGDPKPLDYSVGIKLLGECSARGGEKEEERDGEGCDAACFL